MNELEKQKLLAEKLRNGFDPFKSDLYMIRKPPDVNPSMVHDPEKLKQKPRTITA